MDRSILIGAGAVGALVLLERTGRFAGVANKAAAAHLQAHAADAGVPFTVPESASMVDAHRAFERALGNADHSLAYWIRLEALWLGAYKAGAGADVVNYSLIGRGADTAENFLETLAIADADFVCNEAGAGLLGWNPTADDSAWKTDSTVTPLGRAVCALLQHKLSPIDELQRRAAMLAVTRELAEQMDNADYRRKGDRRSDHPWEFGSVLSLPFTLLRKILPDVSGTVVNIGLLGVAGFLVWKVATR